MDINLAQQQCLIEINNIGSTTYQNICNGEMSRVPWGNADWGLSILVFLVFAVIAIAFIKIVKDY